MPGVIYLILCILTGAAFCKFFFPNLRDAANIKREGDEINLPGFFVLFPAWYLTGTLFVTWLTYITAYIFKGQEKPLIAANAIVMPLVLVILIACFIIWGRKGKLRFEGEEFRGFFTSGHPGFEFFALVTLMFCIIIMYKSFNVKDDTMRVGYSVWGDFGAHLGMIRSFSYSNNFPTGYTYFAGEDIKYHFMHEFLVGNLEFLGLRIDHAFNIPSILSLFSTYLLLFTLTCNVLKSKMTATIGALLFTFRSSPSVFIFLANDRSGHPIKALLENRSYFNYSDYHESWGFWCTRVFCNQRHLAFGITALLLALILFLPYLKEMGEKLSSADRGKWFKTCFLTKDAWMIKDFRLSLGAGLFLGALAFWHGSALIATLSMLFFMAAFACGRLDFLISAVMSVIMAVIQSKCFITGTAVEPSYFFGFIAENRTPFGVLRYIALLTGITLVIAIFGMLKSKGITRYLLLVFSIPFVLSFFLSLTPDIGVNHKWIIISLMLISMYTAYFVADLLKGKDFVKKAVAVILIVCLTATGVTELYIQAKEDNNYMEFDQNNEVTLWLKENVTAQDIVLTDDYALSNQVLGGIMSYFAYEYCTWSAGYDTDGRKVKLIEMMSSTEPNELAYYAAKLGIDYIVVNIGMRECEYYDFNEELMENTFEEVFCSGEKLSKEEREYGMMDYSIRIFDTSKLIY